MQQTTIKRTHVIREKYDELMRSIAEYFPKVDVKLLMQLLARVTENPDKLPMWTIEVFTRPGIDAEGARQMIFEKTGKVPGVYDRGMHYVTDQPLSLEILEEISADSDVLVITGDPLDVGGSRGPAHESH